MIEIMFYCILVSVSTIGLLSWSLKKIFTQKGFVTEKRLNEAPIRSMTRLSDREWEESLPMRKKRIDRWAMVALGFILIPTLFIVVIPFSRDLGYIAFNGIPTFEGIIVSEVIESDRRGGTQLVTIQNEESGQELRITIWRVGSRQQGDFVRVQYLPFIRQGANY